MGGDGVLRIGLTNYEKFSVIALHGTGSSLDQSLIANGFIPAVLNENWNSKDASGNYIFKPKNGGNTETLFGVTTEWLPLGHGGQEQLFSTNTGSLDNNVYWALLPIADSKTIIQSKGLYKTVYS